MLGVQDQAGIKDAGRQGIGLPFREHVQKVGGVGEIVAGLDGVLAFANQLERRHHRGDLGDQPHHRRRDVVGAIEGPPGIEQPKGRGTGLQGIHGMPPRGEAFHHVADPEADPPVHLHLAFKGLQLIGGGQLPPDQEVGRFQETAVGCEASHLVAAVGELALEAIDIADRRLGRRHPLQAWAKHGSWRPYC